jgi:hypothetical protein
VVVSASIVFTLGVIHFAYTFWGQQLTPSDYTLQISTSPPVRTRTRPARARITIRSACACALRCFTGLSNLGSTRASRAKVCASRRSSFLRGHDHFVSQLAQYTTDPGRMRSDFQRDATARHRVENFPQCFRCRALALLQLDLAGLI